MEKLLKAEEFICNLWFQKFERSVNDVHEQGGNRKSGNIQGRRVSNNLALKRKYNEKMNEFKSKRNHSKNAKKSKNDSDGSSKRAKFTKPQKIRGNLSKPMVDGKKILLESNESLIKKTKMKNIHALHKNLKDIKKLDANIKKIKEESGVGASVEAHSNKQVELAVARAEGLKPKDDPERIKVAIKKEKSRKAWASRVESKEAERKKNVEKRKANLQARKEQRRNVKMKRMLKKRDVDINALKQP